MREIKIYYRQMELLDGLIRQAPRAFIKCSSTKNILEDKGGISMAIKFNQEQKKAIMHLILPILLILTYTALMPSLWNEVFRGFLILFLFSIGRFPFKRKVSSFFFYACLIVLILYSALIILENLFGFSKWIAHYPKNFSYMLLLSFITIEVVADIIDWKKNKNFRSS